jgi:hypothetical protein
MAVLVTADVSGQTKEKYDRMLDVLAPELRRAKGFIAHGAGPAGDSVADVRGVGVSARRHALLRGVRPAQPA